MEAAASVPGRARWTLCGVLLALYLGLVLVVLLWPNQPQRSLASFLNRTVFFLHSLGVPGWFDLPALEFTGNIVMFVPLGLLVALAVPRRVFALVLVAIPAFSGLLELSQALLIPERLGSLRDVLANTIGGYLGALLARAIRVRAARSGSPGWWDAPLRPLDRGRPPDVAGSDSRA